MDWEYSAMANEKGRKEEDPQTNIPTTIWREDKFDKELNDFMVPQRTQNSNLNKKVVYNNSSKQLTEKQMNLLALGWNFVIAPKKFPLIDYIAALAT